jgi:hypothetical protein
MSPTDDFGSRAGDLWSTLEVLRIATQSEAVTEWIAESEITGDTFVSGYPVFIETGVRHFLSLCRSNRNLELEEDYITRRALVQLPPLSEIPHSSETLNLYRNCNQIQSALRGCSTPEPASLISEVAETIEPLLEIRRQLEQEFNPVNVDVPSDVIRRDAVVLTLYIAFQQTRNNRPVGYGPSNLNSWLDGGFREGSVQGYAATLQYLWSTVLNPEEYVDSGIPDIIQSDRYTTRDPWEREQAGVERGEETALGSYRPQIEEVVLEPLDARYPDDLTSLSLEAGDLLHWTGGPLKQYLSPLVSDSSTPLLDELEPAARVAYGLIWFEQGEWLGQGSFSRAPLIETVIRGLAATYDESDEVVPLHVTRFNHPVERGNLVSYAILQRMPERSLGDPSGWLIFNNVAADFEIEGEHRIKYIESLIEEIPDTPVKRTTIQVDRQEFIDAVAGRLSDDYVLQTQANTRMLKAIEAGRGVLVELLTAYVLAHRYPDSRVHWSDKREGEEIDVWVEHDEYIRVIECKSDLAAAGVDKTRQQLLRKAGRFEPDRVVESEIWTWEPPSESSVESLEAHDITVSCVSESSELITSDTDDLSLLFSEFLPEITERHPLMPAPRYSY